MAQTQLKRSLSLPLLTFYGLGTIVGAGIYVLIGKVAGVAGASVGYAFLLAGIIACFTAFSYAELSSRFPKSAGVAVYLQAAWQRKWLSQTLGWMVTLTGIVSAAVIISGFVGYLQVFIALPPAIIIIGLTLVLTLIAVWGIKESAILITVITLLELGGLLFVLLVSGQGEAATAWSTIFHFSWNDAQTAGILLGAFLAFYAFIGFEDMVNVAEEVKNPERTLPLAILLAISISALLYIAVSMMALRSIPAETLALSDAPMADIIKLGGYSPIWISLISLIALTNGALVQMIMASRVLYGMGNQGMAPKFLSTINKKTQTPIIGTMIVAVLILIFALWLPLTALAKLASFIVLSVFTLVNAALVTIKYRTPQVEEGVATYPVYLPIIATVLCFSLLIWQISTYI